MQCNQASRRTFMNMQTCTKSNLRRNEDSSIYKHFFWSYSERSDGSLIPKNKTDFLTFLSLMLSWYFEEKQRSFTSGDFWVLPTKMAGHSFPVSLGLPRWRPCQIPDPGATLKCQNPYPGEGTLSQFPVGKSPFSCCVNAFDFKYLKKAKHRNVIWKGLNIMQPVK